MGQNLRPKGTKPALYNPLGLWQNRNHDIVSAIILIFLNGTKPAPFSRKKDMVALLVFLCYNCMGDTMKEKQEIAESRYNTVTKANELIQKSKYALSVQQQKIVLYLISQINPHAEEFKILKFKIKDFCKICGINYNSGFYYTEIKKQIKKISDKSCYMKLPNGKETLLRWIKTPYFDEENGTIEIELDNNMKPFLLQLRENFTQYELSYTLLFKSKYSIRLFELLESYHFHKLEVLEKEIDIEELKYILDCENYKQFKDFRTRVIEPSIKEIKENTIYSLEYEPIKESRKIVALKFILTPKEIIEQLQTQADNETKFERGLKP